jgi:hypothetical protein
MTTTNRYWGELPPPKITGGHSSKIQDDGQEGQGNNELSINTKMAGGRSPGPTHRDRGQVKPDRTSTQTDKTDAPTLSTLSPFASPIASEFRGAGLAPRPPSFPAGASGPAYNKDFSEKRRRRESRNRETYESASPVPPPTAPDPPRAPPPVAYKDPYSNGHQAAARSRPTRRSEGPFSPGQGSSDDYHRRDSTQEYHPGDEESFRARKLEPSNGKAPVRHTGSERRAVEHSESNSTHARKGSLSEAEAQRRREWAPDRSPLQRLELTLDSITKEEKRARVEEAELLIKEAKSGRGERAAQNSVRFRNRPVAKAPVPGSHAEPQSLAEAGLMPNPSTKQKDQLQKGTTVERTRPSDSNSRHMTDTAKGFDYQSQLDQSPVSSDELSSMLKILTYR